MSRSILSWIRCFSLISAKTTKYKNITSNKLGGAFLSNKMSQCKACGKDIAKGVKKCVHCGKDQRNFFMRHKIFTGFLSIIALIVVVSVTSGDNGQEADSTENAEAEANNNENEYA